MKKAPRTRVQIFVLTPEEKKVVVFVLCAFVLGLGTMRYRQTHPRPPPPLTPEQQRTASAANARERAAHGRREPAAERHRTHAAPSAGPSATDDDDE